MIQITKQEAKMIRKHMPHVHIKSTVHKAYAESSPALLRFLNNPNKHERSSRHANS